MGSILSEVKVIHYSREPIVELIKTPYIQKDTFKPVGFWFSVEGFPEDIEFTWKNWCEGEDFYLECLVYKYDIILKKSANILFLHDAEGVHLLTEQYHFNPTPHFEISSHLNWAKLTTQYDGIIIAPYLWELRCEPSCLWYHTWDCASGCIWNLDAIESFTLLEDCQSTANQCT